MRVSPHVRVTLSPDSLVLMHIKDGLIFSANGTASRIWRDLEAGRTENQIACALSTEFNVNLDMVMEDVRGFVQSLVNRRILLQE